jgi:hypothetical protein
MDAKKQKQQAPSADSEIRQSMISEFKTSDASIPVFFDGIAKVVEQARDYVGRTADITKCVTYFEIGRKIILEEQGGKTRAEYGAGLLKALSRYLAERCGKGFSLTNLKQAKKFYLTHSPLLKALAS